MSDTDQKSVLTKPVTTLKSEPPYHILSKRKKWGLVVLASLAGCFSPLSSNIYFPAIDSISSSLGVSLSLVALTITVYMVVQGIAPSLFGAFSDTYGRRLTFTVSLVIYTVANLALAFTSSFPMLLVLRGVQAAGSAATISISAGVIADIANPRERGGFMGTNAGIRMTGQAIGPVIGGVLNKTQRKVAGNGSIPLSGFHKPLIYVASPPKAWGENTEKPLPQRRGSVSLKKAFSPLGYIFEKDIAILLAWGAVAYTAWSMVTSSTTTALLKGFPYLNEWQIGLCFLPNGFGCVAGSLCTGWLLDKSFKGAEARYRAEHDNSSALSIIFTMSGTLVAIFERVHIDTTRDALIAFEAYLSGEQHGFLQRPLKGELQEQKLIRGGNVFIYNEHQSGIKCWTDGMSWGSSRILGDFLVYRELQKPQNQTPLRSEKPNGLVKKTRSASANWITPTPPPAGPWVATPSSLP
ncbi:hypothetical protein CDV36_011076 [Fusarium kuroshium]|uniref:Major facilitator superfamily (MFS) profile domain-containing protein n=1 Tax=Fusarium kuroshium TaxID=2010991 RepID=A0A3M2RWN2_9HYPO|nr:hypothetical protein CDV36_011076 [Fusarium kuroshium]